MSAVVSSILARHDPIYWSIPYILPLFQKYVTVSGEVKPYVQEHQLWMVVQDHLRHKHCAISTNNVLEEGFSDRPPPIVQILHCTGNIAATDHWSAPPPLHVQSLVLCKNKLCANFVQEAMPLRTWIAAPSPALVQIFSNSVQILCRSCFSARDLSSQIADLFLLVVHHPL